MINADIFVMSKSTFSMVPAIYNSNMVIYHPFFFNPLKSWISAKDSNFESSIKKYILNFEVYDKGVNSINFLFIQNVL